MLKGIINIICLVILVLLITAEGAFCIPTTRLEPLDLSITAGETFDVEVRVDGVTDVDPIFGPDELLAFGFDVVYDPGFTYNGATVWATYDDSSLFPYTDVAGSYFPGVSGDDILLATLSFTAPSTAGFYSLGIFSDLGDPNEGLHTLLYPQIDMSTGIDIEVSGSTPAPVPEPGTLLLVAMGGAGIGIWRRKGIKR